MAIGYAPSGPRLRHPSVKELARMPERERDHLLGKSSGDWRESNPIVTVGDRQYHVDAGRLAKQYGAAHGYAGEVGGWIYRAGGKVPICQGWRDFARLLWGDISAYWKGLVWDEMQRLEDRYG